MSLIALTCALFARSVLWIVFLSVRALNCHYYSNSMYMWCLQSTFVDVIRYVRIGLNGLVCNSTTGSGLDNIITLSPTPDTCNIFEMGHLKDESLSLNFGGFCQRARSCKTYPKTRPVVKVVGKRCHF